MPDARRVAKAIRLEFVTMYMKYPHKQTYTVFFTLPSLFRKKVVTLEIPQGSIGEIDRVRNMGEEDMSIWLASALIAWGATR